MQTLLINKPAPVRIHQMPAISLVLPFEPKMARGNELEQKMKNVLANVKEKLMLEYDRAAVSEMMMKLSNIANHLDYSTHKKSLAIFVSPDVEKVYYLDIPVHEKVVIDEPFELRDLVHSKKDFQKYLVLVLSGEWTRVYLGDVNHLVRIISNIPGKIDAFKNDLPERVGNFSDPSHRKEVVLNKFLRYTDSGLNLLLDAYPLPLFVVGPEKLLGYFKHMTKNSQSIVGFVKGNFINVPESSIREAITPHISDWRKVKEKDLLNHIETAAGTDKLSTGLRDVLKEAKRKKGRLLIIEESFSDVEKQYLPHIFSSDQHEGNDFFIIDAIDQAIEYVIQSGGDVEFVHDGALKDYNHVALIRYY
jgi:hypothetical protein